MFKPIDNSVDAEDVPCIRLGHLALGVVDDKPYQGDYGSANGHVDAIGVDQRVFFQNQFDRLRNLIVAVLLDGRYFEAVDDIAAARHPPGQHSCESFVRETAHLTVQRHNAVTNRYFDRTTRRGHLRFPEDFPAAAIHYPNTAAIDCRLFEQGVANMIANFAVAHRN